MNHPRIDTRHLSHETIKSINELLIAESYRLKHYRDTRPIISFSDFLLIDEQIQAAIQEADKIQRFLDR